MTVYKYFLKYVFFPFSLVSSYFLGLLFYDSTTGLDFQTYFRNVRLFLGEEIDVFSSQGNLYYFFVAKYISFTEGDNAELTNIILNNSIQFINFIFFCIGLIGLYKLTSFLKYKDETIYLTFSIVSFFPTAFYFRLTMKPEILAFSLMPFLFYNLNKYFKNNDSKTLFYVVIVASTLFTLKGSITGMVLLSLIMVYYEKIFEIKKYLKLIISTFLTSIIFIFVNYQFSGRWLFTQAYQPDPNLRKWDNTATKEFFYNVDLKNLLENPYQYIHSDSFLSITLLDTLSDYFNFFWNHKERTNFIAYGRIEFSENFLIQAFLPQYISILFTFTFYSLIIIFLFKKVRNIRLISLPFAGIMILMINSFGIPIKNFDPNTGDLFKVHYYSFLVTISFIFLIMYFIEEFKIFKIPLLLLIPTFLLAMGFPKRIDEDIKLFLFEKFSYSEFCQLTFNLVTSCF